ncbi:unnamed protein product [Echinostoma caproni]|uniref:Ubiquitin-like domain-containing protein n=1 Tax=Echinostoma caproni TaxID=27848 RepID=A0A183A0H8_9TREM|nr:unnamed protein product [Echinostoma caproni]
MKAFVRLTTGDIVCETVDPDAVVVDTLKSILGDRLGPLPERIEFVIGSRKVKKDDQFRKYSDSIVPIFEATHAWRGVVCPEKMKAKDSEP